MLSTILDAALLVVHLGASAVLLVGVSAWYRATRTLGRWPGYHPPIATWPPEGRRLLQRGLRAVFIAVTLQGGTELARWALGTAPWMRARGVDPLAPVSLLHAATLTTMLVALWLLRRAERERVDGDTVGWPRVAEYGPAAALYTPRGARARRLGSTLLTCATVVGLLTAVAV